MKANGSIEIGAVCSNSAHSTGGEEGEKISAGSFNAHPLVAQVSTFRLSLSTKFALT